MKFWVILKVALRALVRNKVRSLLTTLGIIVGIAAVIAMMAVGEGATSMIKDQINSMGNNLVVIFPGSSRTMGMRGGRGSARNLTQEDGEVILKEVPEVVAMTPIIRTGAQVVYQENNWSTSIQGVNTSFLDIGNWVIKDGDFFTEEDVRGATRVCVLGQSVVNELFGGEDPVGKTIRIKSMPFRVIGILGSKGSAGFGMDQDDIVVTPLSTVRRFLKSSSFNDVDMIQITLSSMEVLDQARESISTILRQRHHLAPKADDDFTIMDLTEVTQTITQVSVVMTILLTVIASISLFVGGIGIMNIMLVSVTERTREIGLRMAVGARRQDILLQFLVESMVLAGIGGVLGIALGIAAANILSSTAGWPVLISINYIIIAIAFSAAVGVFFGFYPAWRAAGLNPIDALRHE